MKQRRVQPLRTSWRGLLLLLSLVLAAGACSGAPDLADTAETPASDGTIQGTLRVTVGDDFESGATRRDYFVELDDGSRTALRFDVPPTLESGTRVSISGDRLATSEVRVRAMTPLGSVPSRTTSALTAATQKKVAVIMYNFQNDPSQPNDAAWLRSVIFTGAESTKAYYQEQTYGQVELVGKNSPDGDFYGWYTIPRDNTPCDYGSWNVAAQNLAQADGFNANDYDFVIHWVPWTSACNFGGMAEIRGRNSIINYPVSAGARVNAGVIAHELGHNFGAWHSSSWRCKDAAGNPARVGFECTPREYGDSFCTMGAANFFRHMNAYQKRYLGWLPETNVATATTTGTYTIVPLETASTGIKALRIPRGDFYYYIEFRRPFGLFDNFASTDPVVNGASIRLVREVQQETYLLDMNPTTEPADYIEFADAALGAGKTFVDDAFGVSITVQSVSSSGVTVRVVPPDDTGGGLRGEYFQNSDFTNYSFPRNSNINFDWGAGTPHPAMEADTFSIRWTGFIRPRYTQTYTFTTRTDDGVRLWVNGQKIVDDWTSNGVREKSGTIALTAGTLYPIRMEYYENTGTASAKLWWRSTSQAKEIIPGSRLHPPDINCNWEDDATFCARLGKNCGTVSDVNNCGYFYTAESCGTCTSPQTCGASNVCQ